MNSKDNLKIVLFGNSDETELIDEILYRAVTCYLLINLFLINI